MGESKRVYLRPNSELEPDYDWLNKVESLREKSFTYQQFNICKLRIVLAFECNVRHTSLRHA